MLKLNKEVTPRKMKVFKKHGLIKKDASMEDLGMNLLVLYTEEKALAEVMNVAFEGEFTPEAVLDVDLKEVGEKLVGFLTQLAGA